MNIEHVSAPLPEPSPQMRYASLHRAVEQGMATEATWRDLVRVCADLGLHDEARRAFREVFDPFEQKRLRALLVRRGILSVDEAAAAPEPPARVFVERTSILEETVDALRFLFLDHMPLTVVVATLTFPLVVGLGGVLTAGSPIFVFPAIAMLPGLTVLGIVGALGRRILVESAEGIDDPPPIPDAGTLFGDAARFLLDVTVLFSLLLGPAIALPLLGGPIGATLCAAAVGALLLPMALALRQLRGDWQALSPNVLFGAIVKGGKRYLGAAGFSALLFLPAAIAGIAAAGSHFYLQVSVIGPLVVAPLFVSSRLLGRTLALRRNELGNLLSGPGATAPAPVAAPAPAVEAARAATPRPRPNLRAEAHPEARQAAPGARRAPASAQAPAARPQAAPAQAAPAAAAQAPRQQATPQLQRPRLTAKPNPNQVSNPNANARQQRQPQAQQPAPQGTPRRAPANPAPAQPARQQPQPARPQPARPQPSPQTNQVVGDAAPDLTKLPGVQVVTGKTRQLVGAAAPTQIRDDDAERAQTPPPIPVPPSLREPPPRAAKPQPPARPPIRRRS